jgi:serine/threonine protein kinase
MLNYGDFMPSGLEGLPPETNMETQTKTTSSKVESQKKAHSGGVEYSNSSPTNKPSNAESEKAQSVADKSLKKSVDHEESNKHHTVTQESKDQVSSSIDDKGKVYILPSYTKEGKPVVGKTLDKGRTFNLLDEENHSYDVEIVSKRKMEEGENFLTHATENTAYLVSKDDDGHSYIYEVNLTELSDKLLMNKDKLRTIINGQYSKNGQQFTGLGSYLRVHMGKFDKLAQIHEEYGKLYSKIKDQPYSATLLKVVKEFHKKDLGEDNSLNVRLGDKYKRDGSSDPIAIVATKTAGDLKVTLKDYSYQLGSGSYGVVYNVFQLDTNTNMALKRTHGNLLPKEFERASNDIFNEYKMLKYIHSDGIKIGIQKPLHVCHAFTDNSLGYISDIYDRGSGIRYVMSDEYKNLPTKVKLNFCLQILEGEVALADKNILHTDKNLNNTLVDGENICIADFGDAQEFDPKNPPDPKSLIITPDHKPLNDIKNGVSLKTPIYQDGLMLYGLLTRGGFPYPVNAINFLVTPGEPFDSQPLIDRGYPQELIDLVKSMCAHNAVDRPSALEARDALKAIMQKYPDIEEKIVVQPPKTQKATAAAKAVDAPQLPKANVSSPMKPIFWSNYYHGYPEMNKQEAEDILKNRPVKSFLVRDDETQREDKVISFKMKDEIRHITYMALGTGQYIIPEMPETRYETMDEAIDELVKRGLLKKGVEPDYG